MEFEKISYFEKAETPKHRSFIASQDNCVLCNSVLEVRHMVKSSEQTLTEEAFCPHCDVKTRTKTHVLH